MITSLREQFHLVFLLGKEKCFYVLILFLKINSYLMYV